MLAAVKQKRCCGTLPKQPGSVSQPSGATGTDETRNLNPVGPVLVGSVVCDHVELKRGAACQRGCRLTNGVSDLVDTFSFCQQSREFLRFEEEIAVGST